MLVHTLLWTVVKLLVSHLHFYCVICDHFEIYVFYLLFLLFSISFVVQLKRFKIFPTNFWVNDSRLNYHFLFICVSSQFLRRLSQSNFCLSLNSRNTSLLWRLLICLRFKCYFLICSFFYQAKFPQLRNSSTKWCPSIGLYRDDEIQSVLTCSTQSEIMSSEIKCLAIISSDWFIKLEQSLNYIKVVLFKWKTTFKFGIWNFKHRKLTNMKLIAVVLLIGIFARESIGASMHSMDVIVVEQPYGNFVGSPFHLQFEEAEQLSGLTISVSHIIFNFY